MPEFGALFGSPEGQRLGEHDAQQALLNGLHAQQLGENIKFSKQVDPIRVRMEQAQMQQEELKAAQEKKLGEIMSGSSFMTGQDGSAAEVLEKLAQASGEAGKWSAVPDLIGKATEIRRKEAVTRKAQVESEKELILGYQKRLELSGELLNGAHDTQSFHDAIARYEYMTGDHVSLPDPNTGELKPYREVEYSPELVERMKSSTMTAKQNADLALKRSAETNKELNSESLRKHRDFLEDIKKQELDLKKKREARLEKNGGKPVTAPTVTEIDQASNLIKADFPESKLSKTERETAAFSIASRAKVLRQNNPALDPDAALRRALEEAKRSGEFMTMTKPGMLDQMLGTDTGIGGSKTQKFEPRGKTSDSAIPMQGMSEKDLVKDKWYSKNGYVFQWTKDGWANFSKVGEKPKGGASDEEDDKEEE